MTIEGCLIAQLYCAFCLESHGILNMLNCHCALFSKAVVAIFLVVIHYEEILIASNT